MDEQKAYDWKDTSWWDKREMGSPDDPYNKIPKLSEDDKLYKEYKETCENGIQGLLKESLTDDGWTPLTEKDGIKSFYKDNKDDPIRRFKGVGVIKATAEIVRLHLVQLDLRKHWDEMYLGGEFKIEVTSNIRVVYYKFAAPWPVSSRDILALGGESIEEDGTVVSCALSIQRDDMPDIEGFVRANCAPSGFVVKPIENDKDGIPQCKVSYIVQIDPSGWIPAWVSNLVNADQPLVINKLAKVLDVTGNAINHLMEGLVKTKPEEWKAVAIKNAVTTAITKNEGAASEMLWDPIRYLITGSRVGDASITVQMEEMGKEACMKKLWEGIIPYMKAIKLTPEMAEAAKEAGLDL